MEAADVHCKISSDPPLIDDQHHSADWASMPGDILKLILERLVAEVSDYVHFAAACKSWLSAARDHLAAKRKQPFFPVLLLPTQDNDSQIHRGWYNPIEDRFINSQLDVPYYNKWCCSSSKGWLIFQDENLALILYNPFTRATIHLPAITPNEEETRDGGLCNHHLHHYAIPRVSLSTDPSIDPENYEAVAVLPNGMVFFYKCGWSGWILVMPYQYFDEATYLNGKFYLCGKIYPANRHHHLVACIEYVCSQVSSVSVTWRSLAARPTSMNIATTYLAGTRDGHVLLIDRFLDHERIEIPRDDGDNIVRWHTKTDDYSRYRTCYVDNSDWGIELTSHFKVYEMKESGGKMELKKLKTLEDQSLFLGLSDSEMIWTGDFPEYKANRIYYTDHQLWHFSPPNDALGVVDMGVFDLETRSRKLLDVAGPGKGHRPRPIWILPKANLETTF